MIDTELVIAKAVTVALELAIASQASRSGRRHDSRPMLYLAAGSVLISVGAVLESLCIDLADWDLLQAGVQCCGSHENRLGSQR